MHVVCPVIYANPGAGTERQRSQGGFAPCAARRAAGTVAGEDCYLLKVRVESTGALAEVLDRIRALPTVASTGTTIVLRTLFERPLFVAG